MVQIFILSFFSSLVLTLPLISSPLMMGLWVLFIALSLSAWIGVIGMSWFGLILFLIYIGGMLVMFIYFVAMTPNQRHDAKVFFVFTTMFSLMFVSLMTLELDGWFSKCYGFSNSSMLFSASQGAVLILIFSMLLVSLIIVVKVTRRVYGPLRPFN